LYGRRIGDIERKIANTVALILNQQTSNWLKERVDEHIRKEALRRMREKHEANVQEYITLGELAEIMKRKDNRPLFRAIFIGGTYCFSDEDHFWAAFRFLNNVRGDIAHGRSRPFRFRDEEPLNIYLDKLEKCCESSLVKNSHVLR
jgi:hypothetical protein